MRRLHWYTASMLAIVALGWASVPASAHPVPLSSHDRTILVRLERDGTSERVSVIVAYRLEVDERTVLDDDMPPFADEVKFADFGRDRLDAFYGEFTRIYAPIFARKLRADIDGAGLKFACVKRSHTVRDENSQLLGHLRCDFEFRASAPVAPEKSHRFSFREGNYLLQKGQIDLSFTGGSGIRILDRVAPSVGLKKQAVNFLAPGDDDRLRQVRATFELSTAALGVAPEPSSRPTREEASGYSRLFSLILHSDHVWLILLIAAWLGAVHALTPGHGKTMMAAYLIGERGTVWHAIVLGLVTTFTHTAVVLAAGLALWLIYGDHIPKSDSRNLQIGLELIMGVLVVCVGVWLLLRRLAGKADHVHIGGHGHHHHGHGHHHHHHHGHGHSHADHDHDAQGRPVPRTQPVGWRGLVLMGMSGGIVPCWDALAILAFTVAVNRIWLALPLALAFSAGLAAVLVLIGILVVRFQGFASSRWGEGRLVRSLPVLSALVVTALGVWLCYEAVHSAPPEPPDPARVVESRP
jgi:ABC-type nickel/cobalt efflux system permease component RcnA